MDEIAIVKLINNERIIGQILHVDRTTIAIFAPMSLNEQDIDNKIKVTLYPYDPFSDTVMAIFNILHALTVTVPKEEIEELYKDNWNKYYPTLESVKKKLVKELKQKYGEENIYDSFSGEEDQVSKQPSKRKLH
jgi:hypothetical protein